MSCFIWQIMIIYLEPTISLNSDSQPGILAKDIWLGDLTDSEFENIFTWEFRLLLIFLTVKSTPWLGFYSKYTNLNNVFVFTYYECLTIHRFKY